MRQIMQNRVAIQDSIKTPELFFNYDQAIEKVKVDQQIYMIAPTLKHMDAERDIQMHCYEYNSDSTVPKYTIHVVDAAKAELLVKFTCAALIVPQGKEAQTNFSTETGRQSLCQQAQCSRLIVIFLGHGHKFDGGLKQVQDELEAKIVDLAPTGCQNHKSIPIMTVGEDIGEKTIIQTNIEGMIVQDLKTSPTSGVILR